MTYQFFFPFAVLAAILAAYCLGQSITHRCLQARARRRVAWLHDFARAQSRRVDPHHASAIGHVDVPAAKPAAAPAVINTAAKTVATLTLDVDAEAAESRFDRAVERQIQRGDWSAYFPGPAREALRERCRHDAAPAHPWQHTTPFLPAGWRVADDAREIPIAISAVCPECRQRWAQHFAAVVPVESPIPRRVLVDTGAGEVRMLLFRARLIDAAGQPKTGDLLVAPNTVTVRVGVLEVPA